MDLLTHVLIAYLLTFGLVGLHPQYLAAGALAGGLPDADILLFPLARRYPIFRHHGITHSVFGVTIVAGVGSLIAPLLAPGTVPIYFLVMEVGGCSHILEDGFTQFSVPPLAPFSDKRLQMDADRAINFATLAVSAVAFYLLLGIERNHVTLSIYYLTLYVLVAFFVAYFAVRLAGRLTIGRRLKRTHEFQQIVPTANPFNWLLLSEVNASGRVRTSWARYAFGRGIVQGPYTVDGPLEAPPHTGAPTTEKEALDWSYPLARKASEILAMTYHFGEAFRDAAGEWIACWYSLEFSMLGRSAAVRVRFPVDGGPAEVKSTFYRPRLRAL